MMFIKLFISLLLTLRTIYSAEVSQPEQKRGTEIQFGRVDAVEFEVFETGPQTIALYDVVVCNETLII